MDIFCSIKFISIFKMAVVWIKQIAQGVYNLSRAPSLLSFSVSSYHFMSENIIAELPHHMTFNF